MNNNPIINANNKNSEPEKDNNIKESLKLLSISRVVIKKFPNLADAWFKKGLACMQLEQYADALFAFVKAYKLNKNNNKQIKEIKEILILLEINSSKYLQETKDTESEKIFRPFLCKKEYLEQLNQLKGKSEQSGGFSFTEQQELVIEQIDFISKHHSTSPNNSTCFIDLQSNKNDISSGLIYGEISNRIIFGLNFTTLHQKSNDEIIEYLEKDLLDIDHKCINIWNVLKDDIYFEDTKLILRIIFKTIYNFDRHERYKIVDKLPWNENSLYLFDFCTALFVGDDIIAKEKGIRRNNMATYPFNGDLKKQNLLMLYFVSILHHTAIVKMSIPDIIDIDLPRIKSFFETLLLSSSNPDLVDKMEDLPNLKSILWYSKKLYNYNRLLSLLPAVPGNSEKLSIPFHKTISSSTIIQPDMEIDIIKYLQALPTYNPEILGFFIPTLKRMVISGHKFVYQDLIDFGFVVDEEITINYGVKYSSGPRTVDFIKKDNMTPFSSKLMLASNNDNYLDSGTLVGRLAFLRKIQLIGEIFILRNLGQELKNIDFINTENLNGIRNGLIHIESHSHNKVIIPLEIDTDMLEKIFRELQTLKEDIYEHIAMHQSNFPAWPNDDSFKSKAGIWKDFSHTYWEAVKKNNSSCQSLDPLSNFLPNCSLLPDEEYEELINLIDKSSKNYDKFFEILSGKNIFPELQKRETYVQHFKIKVVKNDRTEKNTIKRVNTLFNKAKKEYNRKKQEQKKQIQLDKSKIKFNISKKMSEEYITLDTLAKNFYKNGEGHNPENSELCLLLNDRMELFNKLYSNDIKDITKSIFEKSLTDILEKNIDLFLASSYIFGQVISLLNEILARIDICPNLNELRKRLEDYVALRNHMEHIDPVLETQEFAYQHMTSESIKMISAAIIELMFDYKEIIFNLKKLPVKSDEDIKRIKQNNNLNTEMFNINQTNNNLPFLSQNEHDKNIAYNDSEILIPVRLLANFNSFSCDHFENSQQNISYQYNNANSQLTNYLSTVTQQMPIQPPSARKDDKSNNLNNCKQ